MAVVPWSVVPTAVDGQSFRLVKWTGLGVGDTGVPFAVAQYTDKTVQFLNMAAGMTVEGSLNPDAATASYHTLNDPQGNPLSANTTNKIENILEHCYLLRPSGDGDLWLLLASTR